MTEPDPKTVEPVQDSINDGPFCDTRAFQSWSLLAILTLFCAISMEYLRSDLWMDEIITFIDYGGQETWTRILTYYPIANNHILFSVILWWWMRPFYSVVEEIIRFPNLVFALGAIIFMHRQGRRFFGNAGGYFLTMIWALSPIYLAFFWQLRGYGLTMALALVATYGAFHMLQYKGYHGLGMYAVGAVLLPCVIPSNIFLNAALGLFIFVIVLRRGQLKQKLSLLALAALASVIGLVLYLPIWHKVLRVAAQTAGWQSGWQVAGHWCQAYFTHAGLFMLAIYAIGRHLQKAQAEETDSDDDTPADESVQRLVTSVQLLPSLLVCCVAVIVPVALLMSPFPRVFLGFLAPLTLCALIGYRECIGRNNRYLILVTFFLFANALVWYQMTDYTMRSALASGKIPQNLIQQFYARNSDISEAVKFMAANNTLPPHTKIFTHFEYFIALDFAWQRFQPVAGSSTSSPSWQIECLDGGSKWPLKNPPENYPYFPQFILAYSRREAQEAYRRTVGYEVALEPIISPAGISIFQVVGIASGDIESPFTPFVPGGPENYGEPEPQLPPPESPAIEISYPMERQP